MIIDELITDRTQADVDEINRLTEAIKAGTATAEEVQQYLSGINKGAYNATDLNRVEAAVTYLFKRFTALGYPISLVTFTLWENLHQFNKYNLTRYIENVAKIRAMFPVYPTTPPTPTADITKFGYEEANNLEIILRDVDEILDNMAATWFYTGDLYMGEAQ